MFLVNVGGARIARDTTPSMPPNDERMQTLRVLTAIPVFNEIGTVRGVLDDVCRLTSDVLVVDDGSTDTTPDIIREFSCVTVVRHPVNRGYGQSLLSAFAFADQHGYDWIITLDSDDQHEPARIPAFVDRLERDDVDVISGSRYLRDLPGNTPAPSDRRHINRHITAMLNRTLDLSLTDAFCGFKAYRVAPLAQMALSIPGYAFPIQFWVQAVHRGLRICELPVRLIYNDPTRHFGDILDDPEIRLQQYVEVFHAELGRVSRPLTESLTIADPKA